MEHSPFSDAGLHPDQLEKEQALVEPSIRSVQETIQKIDINTIIDILFGLYSRTRGIAKAEETKEQFRHRVYPHIIVKYSDDINLKHYGERFVSQNEPPQAYSLHGSIVFLAREIVNNDGTLGSLGDFFIIKLLIHEMLHSISTVQTIDTTTGAAVELSGVSKNVGQREGGEFRVINEGLTEVIADAVFSEYLARTGELSRYHENEGYSDRQKLVSRFAGYLRERYALMLFVHELSNETKVSEGEVYQALLTEYLATGDISRSEIIDECKSNEVVQKMLRQFRDNIIDEQDLPGIDDLEKIISSFTIKELAHVHKLVGRDYIGETNKRKVLRGK